MRTWIAIVGLIVLMAELPLGSAVAADAGAADAASAAFDAPAALVDELALVVPEVAPPPGDVFAIFISGDGGWAELDREVSRRLATAEVPVVGWNSRAYYWKRRTPDEAANDLARVIRHFTAAWQRTRVVLIGYSRGADVAPFLVNRLPDDARRQLALVALLGPGRAIAFEFHVSDWLHEPDPKTALPVPAEIAALAARFQPLLVVYGDKEKNSPALELAAAHIASVLALPGDHHFGRDYDALARAILNAAAALPAH